MSRGRFAASPTRIRRRGFKPDAGRAGERKHRMVQQGSDERAELLRAWHLAILRFAVTHASADRLGVLAIANQIDRLGRPDKTSEGFRFFRKTSAELCAAIFRQKP